jgi:tetratricopeptide (TPR) repeat protein
MHARRGSRSKGIYGLSAAALKFLRQEGYLEGAAADADADFTFRDRVVIRTVSALEAARVPPRTISRALKQLRPWLSEGLPLSRLAFDAAGEGIRVREGDVLWEPASGQYALPLEVLHLGSNVVSMARRRPPQKSKKSAHAHYMRGNELERDDARAARAAYESCLAGDCRHLEARINLGRLLHLEGLLREAEAIYRGTDEPSATLYFNLGILLEDLKRDSDAIAAYREAIVHDPGMADAHFNLSLLHERAGEVQASFRHLLAYRRLAEQFGS